MPTTTAVTGEQTKYSSSISQLARHKGYENVGQMRGQLDVLITIRQGQPNPLPDEEAARTAVSSTLEALGKPEDSLNLHILEKKIGDIGTVD